MNTKILALLAAAAVAIAPVAVSASTLYHFLVVNDTFGTSTTFNLAASPIPDTFSDNEYFTINGTTFYDTAFEGGLLLANGENFAGEQVFEDFEHAPTFVLGTYVFSNRADTENLQNGTLTISLAVPEPATWAMMVGGFGIVGAAARLRAHKSKLVFA